MLTNKTARNALLVLACLPALAGCKLLGIGGQGIASNASLQERLPDDFGAQQLAAGRKALTDGHVADAIESFMLAKIYPAQAAAASNGLAVAYSRLGRTDLTERFFREAIALAPQDERFRSNLAKFYATNPIPRVADSGAVLAMMQDAAPVVGDEAPAVAVGTLAAPAPVVAEAAAPAPRVLAGGITVENGAGRVRRVSSNEIMISSGQSAAPVATVRRPRQAVIEVGARASAPAAYPVRVTLGDPAGATKRPAQYPVRVELAPR